jgi:hypothetical protein
MKSLSASIVFLALLPLATGCGHRSNQSSGVSRLTPGRIPTSPPVNSIPDPHNPSAPVLPDPAKTPGDVLEVASSDVCTSGYSKLVRNVPSALKRQVYESYGITHREKGEFEIDHLISLELGGSNSVRNLWPQSFLTQPWNAKVKDQLENELHSEICSGKIDMRTAQQEIASDWIAAYKKHFHTDRPLAEGEAAKLYNGNGHRRPSSNDTETDDAGASAASVQHPILEPTDPRGDVKVWVNTRSGAYWKPGTEYYGKTKQGKYMSERDAVSQGFHAAGGQ